VQEARGGLIKKICGYCDAKGGRRYRHRCEGLVGEKIKANLPRTAGKNSAVSPIDYGGFGLAAGVGQPTYAKEQTFARMIDGKSHVATATLNISIKPRRMLSLAEAAIYCGLPLKAFRVHCQVRTVEMTNSVKLYDLQDLDQWIDSLKSGLGSASDNDILDRLSA
jgi:hypothetical protein